MELYVCKKCGTAVALVKKGHCLPTCCGTPMEEVLPGTSDGAVEKHVPVVAIDGNLVTVAVGSAEHPMADAHYIEWIAIETSEGRQRKTLNPGDAPKAVFALAPGETFVSAWAYCNLHGLWKLSWPRLADGQAKTVIRSARCVKNRSCTSRTGPVFMCLFRKCS